MNLVRNLFQYFFHPPSFMPSKTDDVNVLLLSARERILTALLRSAAVLSTLTVFYLFQELLSAGGIGGVLYCLHLAHMGYRARAYDFVSISGQRNL